MYNATYHGLHDWHKHVFEHLGWMILAKNRKYDTKIKAYTESIQHLQNALKEKIDITQDRDRVVDLQDLIYNVEILKNYTDKIFKKKKSRKSSRKSSK